MSQKNRTFVFFGENFSKISIRGIIMREIDYTLSRNTPGDF
jgi:hypothetical protein